MFFISLDGEYLVLHFNYLKKIEKHDKLFIGYVFNHRV